jgi:hypothetical protein
LRGRQARAVRRQQREGGVGLRRLRGRRVEVEGEERVVNGRWGVVAVGDCVATRNAGDGVVCGLGGEVCLVAVSVGSVSARVLAAVGLVLFRLLRGVELEDVYLQGLLVLPHFAENDGSRFVEIGV